jgi:hypothetical protein
MGAFEEITRAEVEYLLIACISYHGLGNLSAISLPDLG